MQYYRYYGELKKKEQFENSIVKQEYISEIQSKAERFNAGLEKKAYSFVESYEQVTNIGIIIKDSLDVFKLVTDFEKTIGIEIKNGTLEEVPFFSLNSMLSRAGRNGFIEYRDMVLDMFDLDYLGSECRCGFFDDLIEEVDKDTVYKNAASMLSAQLLIDELDRIYTPSKRHTVSGIPVHYLITTDDYEEREGSIQALLQALYANRRIRSLRYSQVEINERRNVVLFSKDLFETSFGGTVIFRFQEDDDTENDLASYEVERIEDICDLMCKYGNKVQIILCLPRRSTKAKDIFLSNLGALSFIEIKETLAYGEKAKEYLNSLAANAGLRTDKNLYRNIEEDKGYLTDELRKFFSDWYSYKMKNLIYPQYKDVVTAKNTQRLKAPEGNAYDKLQSMVGLADAKHVIDQAIDYYKAQKLFAEKGIVRDHPAMHMVFTGNPGTAKTTVARLFAKIMKDNALLSRGNLIEVGRGDLVGKYVGWTAPTVKKKFKEAEGGVLFIDEAYSLVDDRNGSYGDEAINTIVQEMENHRENMVVIFAGYPDKMEEFINKNPGLRSRIAFHVPFEDYDTDSLCKIAELLAKQKGLLFTELAKEKLAVIFDRVKSQEDFGNGRYARNIVEKARMAQASRLVRLDYDSVTKEDLATIRPEDIEMPAEIKPVRKFGFCA